MNTVWIPETFLNKEYAALHFQRIVNHAIKTSGFYRAYLENPQTNIPLLTRDVVRDNNELLLNGHLETGRTSGSTGVPVRISWSELRTKRENLSNQLMLRWMGGPLSRARLISKREAEGNHDALDVCSSVDDQIKFLLSAHKDRNIQSVVSYPSNLHNLSTHIVAHGIDFSFINRVVCYSESFDEVQLQAIQDAFPFAKVWSTYSCSEVGMVAIMCPYRTGYHHIMAHNLGVEVLNKLGQPCEEGELGSLVLTDFFNHNMPFIRYEIGDLAIAGRCPCKQIKLPSVKAVLGKVRGSLKKLDGSPIMFANIAVALRNLDNLKQYQIIQEELRLFTFRFVSDTQQKDEYMKAQILKELASFLGYEVVVDFRKEVFIEREVSGKFHSTICKV